MYKLSDKQIDFILNDIQSRGIVMESLQNDLLDHVCCILEQDLKQEDDFESLYVQTIRTFYKSDLNEIENETINLLTFKNYYAMKKLMILSGIFSAFTMIIGIWFKLMHYPGASIILPVGIMWASFVFMPLLFTLKAKEKQNNKDRIVFFTGGLAILLIGLFFLVRLFGGPLTHSTSMSLFYISAIIGLLVFLPFYISSGVRNPATKNNTIVTAVLILMGYVLFFSMIFNKRHEPMYRTIQTYDYLRSQQILKTERLLADKRKILSDSLHFKINNEIDKVCEELKSNILLAETGYNEINDDFESKEILLIDHSIYIDEKIKSGIKELEALVPEYNSMATNAMNKIPMKSNFLTHAGSRYVSLISLLNQITQVQMLVLQNERELVETNKSTVAQN